MSKLKQLLTIALISYIGFVQAQYTAIPDPIFEAFLIDQELDDVMDGQVLTANISDKTFLQINETDPIFPIEDLTGIQDFVSLEFLIIAVTNCTTIDFGNLTNLIDLDLIMNTNLTGINITGLTNLEQFSASNSNLNSLDISQNLNLIQLGISFNTGNLNSLDVSQHSNLTLLGIPNNNFLELDVRNGTNENIEFFTAVENPNLTCIFVDNAEFSTANWTNIDPTTTFVEIEEECEALSIEEAVALNFNIYPNPVSQFFEIESNQEIKEIEIVDLSGKVVKLFKEGLEHYSISELSEGLYILKIQTHFGKSSQKLIIR